MHNDHEVDAILDDDNSSEGSADIVLNLLFFLLLTTIASGPIWETINPPLRKIDKLKEPPPSSTEYIQIEVDSTNKITVEHYEGDKKKKVKIEKTESPIELYDALYNYYEELKKDSINFSIKIRGDENANFGTILQAMAAAKDHNLEISVQVRKANIEKKKKR
jgi:biopolymer transport protein ExbD